jgi:hypothetical protein
MSQKSHGLLTFFQFAQRSRRDVPLLEYMGSGSRVRDRRRGGSWDRQTVLSRVVSNVLASQRGGGKIESRCLPSLFVEGDGRKSNT